MSLDIFDDIEQAGDRRKDVSRHAFRHLTSGNSFSLSPDIPTSRFDVWPRLRNVRLVPSLNVSLPALTDQTGCSIHAQVELASFDVQATRSFQDTDRCR